MRPPQQTRVPDLIDALLVIARAIPDCAVLDGPTPRQIGKGTTIAIGVGSPAVTSTVVPMEGYAIRYLETSQVVCNVWSWSGGTVLKPHRDRCRDVIAALDSQLRADTTLGGACDLVTLGGQFVWAPEVDSDGASYAVGFTVDAKATI